MIIAEVGEANGATLAGHVEVADFVIFSGLCAVHQFCRVGKYAFISGLTGIPKDVPPFVIAAGDRAKLYGLNLVGLERRNFSKDEIAKLKRAYRILFRSANCCWTTRVRSYTGLIWFQRFCELVSSETTMR